MTVKPLVSIVIPTYRRRDLLPRAVQSALRQSYDAIEVLVCDDEKSAETQALIEAVARQDNRVRYLQNSRAKGACGARNTGILDARGEYVAFLDDDDEFLPARIEMMMVAVEEKWAFIYTDSYRKKADKTVLQKRPKRIDFMQMLQKGQNLVGPMILARRDRLLEVGMFDEFLPASQDYDIALRLLERFGPARNIPLPLAIFHTTHEERISKSKHKAYRAKRRVYLRFYRRMPKKLRYERVYSIRKIQNGVRPLRAFAFLGFAQALNELRQWFYKRRKQ